MPESLQFFSRSNLLELRSDHFQVWLCRPAGINKDSSVWVEGVRPPLKYVFKNNMSSKNSKSWTNSDPTTIFSHVVSNNSGHWIIFQSNSLTKLHLHKQSSITKKQATTIVATNILAAWTVQQQVGLVNRDHCIHIERTNLHCQGIARTRLFGMALTSAEG
jgi:hypothetical protein